MASKMTSKIDYAPHYLIAKKNIHDVYKKLNDGEFTESVLLIDQTIAELRLMRAAVKSHMEPYTHE